MSRAASRPLPTARPRAPRRKGGGNTLVGIFVGLVLGLVLASGVAYYLMKGNAAFQQSSVAKDIREPARDPPKTTRSDKAPSPSEPRAGVPGERPAAGGDKSRFDFYKILPGGEEPKIEPERKASDRSVVEQSRDRPGGRAGDKAGARPEATAAAAPVIPAPAAVPPPASGQVAAAPPADKLAAADPTKGAALDPTKTKAGDRFWLQAGSFASESDAENLKARLAFAGWQANVQQGTLPDKGVRYRVRLGPYDNTDELSRIRGELVRGGFEVAVIKF